jgi:S1-C subfamily serine protease
VINDGLAESIFRVECHDQRNFGTGFVFRRDSNAGYVITCAHVIEKCRDKKGAITVGRRPAEVIEVGDADGFDLAVLRVNGLTRAPPLPLSLNGQHGREFTILGFRSFDRHFLLDQVIGTLGSKVFLESMTGQANERIEAWELKVGGEGSLIQGFSGSPVVDNLTGKVVGIVNYRDKQRHRGVAISAKSIGTVWPNLFMNPTVQEIELAEVVSKFERLLGLPSNTICARKKSQYVLLVDLPLPAAKRLIKLYGDNLLFIPPFEFRRVEFSANPKLPLDISNELQSVTSTESHTFRVSLRGDVIANSNNRVSLVVENTTAYNFDRVTLRLSTPSNEVRLKPTSYRLQLGPTSCESVNISMSAGKPGNYSLHMRSGSDNHTASVWRYPTPGKSP